MSTISEHRQSTATACDIAIVGGGPAGLSAAIWLGRYGWSVVLVDSGDPRNWETRGIHGYLGVAVCTPAELRGTGRKEARRVGATLIDGCVSTAERIEEELFRLTLENGDLIESRRLLLAIGIKDIWPNVPGLEHVYGDTAHHCPDCDGYEARGKKIVVIGSGRSAAGMAFSLTTWSREIVICTNGQPADIAAPDLAKLDALNIPVLETKIIALRAQDSAVRSLELEGGMSLDCERIFFAIGHYPADDLGVQLGCKRDLEGLVEVDAHYHTSVLNVYAAGDIVPGPHLAIAAAADGAMAALAIHASLVPEERKLTK
ncbi:MAG: NAD(P)/FAD-dependent oxidoreductase [Gemmatimonadota bacterium]|nr:NAD(P)/FAD-dependent oxidoreductase [Gemmatimonadota bacterium]